MINRVQLRALVLNELRLIQRSGVLATAVVALALVCALAIWSGQAQIARNVRAATNVATRDTYFVDSLTHAAEDYERRLAVGDTVVQVVRNGVARERRRAAPGAWVLAFEGRPAVLQSYPLAPLALGVSGINASYPTVSFRTAAHALRDDAEIQNPLAVALGRFDLAFVVVYIMPLLIIALTYNVVSGEREIGTLGIVASQAVSIPQLTLVRAMTRASVVVATLAIAILVGAMMATDRHSVAAVTALIAWVVIATVYALCWCGLALLVNAFVRSSAANALALASAWMLFTFVIPSAAATAARSLYPLPSRATELARVRQLTASANRNASALLNALYQRRPELQGPIDSTKPVNVNYLNFAVARRVDTLLLPERLRSDANWVRQQRVVNVASVMSPPLLAARALMTLSGTDAARERRYANALGQFQGTYHEYFLPRFFRLTDISAAEVRTAPVFGMPEPSPYTQLPVLLALILLPAGTVVITCVAARRLRLSAVM